MDTPEKTLDSMQGTFVASLKRNNKQIRIDRAVAIAEDAQMLYKRDIEDMELEIKKVRRARENALDLSPEIGDSLKLAENFDAKKWAAEDQAAGVRLWNLENKLKLAKERYAELFEGSETEGKQGAE